MAAILEHYIAADDDRAFVGETAELGYFNEEASAWLLGFDLGRRLDASERSLIEAFIVAVRNVAGGLAARIVTQAPVSWDSEEEVVHRFELFWDGLEKGYSLES